MLRESLPEKDEKQSKNYSLGGLFCLRKPLLWTGCFFGRRCGGLREDRTVRCPLRGQISSSAISAAVAATQGDNTVSDVRSTRTLRR